MRIPTIVLPAAAAGGGLLIAGVAGLACAALWALLGASPDRAFALAVRCAVCGTLAGAIVGMYRAIDRWQSQSAAEVRSRRDEAREGDSWRNGARTERQVGGDWRWVLLAAKGKVSSGRWRR